MRLDDAWRLYDTFCSDVRVEFAIEPTNLETLWRDFTQSKQFSPKVWNNAYLAAFAGAANLELVTFDQGFKVYTGAKCLILT